MCRQERNFNILAPSPVVTIRDKNTLSVQATCITCGFAIKDKTTTMMVHL